MNIILKKVLFTSILALSIPAFAGCDLLDDKEEPVKEETKEVKKEEPKKEAPKKIEVAAYAPTGDDAALKTEGAKDITVENAMEKAKALEAVLDAALAK